MASGAGAPDDRPPGDQPLGGKALSDRELISALREFPEEELMKYGIKVVRLGVPHPCDNKETAKKTPWYVGGEGYKTIREEVTTPPPGASCERTAGAIEVTTAPSVVPENVSPTDYPDCCYGLSPASSDNAEMQSESSSPDPALPSDDYSESESELESDDESDEEFQEPPPAG